MLKRTYNVTYRIRPNKKTVGVRHNMNMIFDGKLKGNSQNAAKLLRSLCAIHHVNVDAVVLEHIELVSARLAMLDYVRGKLAKWFSKGVCRA